MCHVNRKCRPEISFGVIEGLKTRGINSASQIWSQLDRQYRNEKQFKVGTGTEKPFQNRTNSSGTVFRYCTNLHAKTFERCNDFNVLSHLAATSDKTGNTDKTGKSKIAWCDRWIWYFEKWKYWLVIFWVMYIRL